MAKKKAAKKVAVAKKRIAKKAVSQKKRDIPVKPPANTFKYLNNWRSYPGDILVDNSTSFSFTHPDKAAQIVTGDPRGEWPRISAKDGLNRVIATIGILEVAAIDLKPPPMPPSRCPDGKADSHMGWSTGFNPNKLRVHIDESGYSANLETFTKENYNEACARVDRRHNLGTVDGTANINSHVGWHGHASMAEYRKYLYEVYVEMAVIEREGAENARIAECEAESKRNTRKSNGWIRNAWAAVRDVCGFN